jgi:DNA/RNA-binding domain of Phe-tRNA-synthetase-like protein
METKVRLQPNARDLGIVSPVACILRYLQVGESGDSMKARIEALTHLLAEKKDTILDSHECRGFRELFRRMGYPNQVPAGQRLVESFAQKGFKRFNNVIDAYNLVSASSGCGIGMHDAAALGTILEIKRAGGAEEIIPLFKTKPARVTAGDLVYGSPKGQPEVFDTFAWLGKKDVDSDTHKISDLTTSVLLVVLGNAHTSASFNVDLCRKIADVLKDTTPQITMEFLEVVTD